MSRRIDPEVLADINEPRDVSLSPDGRHVVYTCRPFWIRASKDIQCSLWLAEVGRENSAKRITPTGSYNGSPQFSPDGRYISFLSDRANPGGASALYLLPLEEDGEAFPLTDTSNEMGIGEYKWRPDGKAIAYASSDEKSAECKQKKKDMESVNAHEDDSNFAKLRVIGLETKDIKTLTDGELHVANLEWNVEGTEIAYATYKGSGITEWNRTGAQLHVINVSTTASRELCRFGSLVSCLSWIDDKVFWIMSTVPSSDASSRTVFSINPQNLREGPQAVAYGQTDCAFTFKRSSGRLVVQVMRGLADVVETLDGTEIYNQKHQIVSCDVKLHSAGEDNIVALSYGTTGKPVEVFSVINGEHVQLSQHSGHISSLNLGRAQFCEYTHEDGTPITGYYAVPTAHETSFREHKARPTIVIAHGGPYIRATDSFDIVFNWPSFFLSLGYLVLIPNYRGGCGHGHTYANAVYQDIASSYQDVLWLVKKGVSDGYIDSNRVTMMGWSLGGYLSYLAATRDQDFHFQAIIPGAGITDWSTMAYTTDIPFWASQMSGCSPWDTDDINDMQARKNSPIFYMKNVKSPVLIIHGESDQRTPFEQAVAFYRGMKYRGLDVEFVSYPKEGHVWPVPFEKSSYLDMMKRIEAFVLKHLGEA